MDQVSDNDRGISKAEFQEKFEQAKHKVKETSEQALFAVQHPKQALKQHKARISGMAAGGAAAAVTEIPATLATGGNPIAGAMVSSAVGAAVEEEVTQHLKKKEQGLESKKPENWTEMKTTVAEHAKHDAPMVIAAGLGGAGGAIGGKAIAESMGVMETAIHAKAGGKVVEKVVENASGNQLKNKFTTTSSTTTVSKPLPPLPPKD